MGQLGRFRQVVKENDADEGRSTQFKHSPKPAGASTTTFRYESGDCNHGVIITGTMNAEASSMCFV